MTLKYRKLQNNGETVSHLFNETVNTILHLLSSSSIDDDDSVKKKALQSKTVTEKAIECFGYCYGIV